MQTSQKDMNSQPSINEFLESLSKLPIDDQLMISEIIHKRAIEAKRKEIAQSVKESEAEYGANKTSSGTVDDFIKDVEND
ncbi:MAG TPA: hypothetical protein PKD67_13030 [Ignavibacteriaceae bacterium]|nr:hypothetical protein [Ignavibacteriaceae bacterium]